MNSPVMTNIPKTAINIMAQPYSMAIKWTTIELPTTKIYIYYRLWCSAVIDYTLISNKTFVSKLNFQTKFSMTQTINVYYITSWEMPKCNNFV